MFDVRIAMDDFGTGFTSLASLQKLPIDVLKIDQSFVGGMLADGDSTAIVRAILSLARSAWRPPPRASIPTISPRC